MSGAPGQVCAGCGTALAPAARYCGLCGRPTRSHAARRLRALAREGRTASRGAWVMALIFAGTLAGLVGFSALEDSSPLLDLALWYGGLLALGALALALLGAGAVRASLAGPVRAGALILGGCTGVATLGFGLLWVHLAEAAIGIERGGIPWSEDASWAWLLFEVAALPAVFEEWLCRGVLWTACARLESPRLTLGATALLFGLLHLPGQGPLGALDGIAAGLAFGWLRARTGSLAPGIAAHFVNNALALWAAALSC